MNFVNKVKKEKLKQFGKKSNRWRKSKRKNYMNSDKITSQIEIALRNEPTPKKKEKIIEKKTVLVQKSESPQKVIDLKENLAKTTPEVRNIKDKEIKKNNIPFISKINEVPLITKINDIESITKTKEIPLVSNDKPSKPKTNDIISVPEIIIKKKQFHMI